MKVKRKLSKAKVRALFMCAIYLCLWAGEAQADPVSGTIAALAVSASAGGTALVIAETFLYMTFTVAAVTQAAVAIGLSYLSMVLAGKPQLPGLDITGRLRAGGDLFRSFILGLYCTAGSLVYANTWTFESQAPKAYLTQVMAVSDLPCNALKKVYVNEIPCTYGAGVLVSQGYPLLEFRKLGVDYVWAKFYDGTQTAADAWLVSLFGGHPTRPYTSARKGIGVSYVIMTTRLKPDDPSFTSFPKFKFELEGIPLYDPREDTTAGGSGTQRWDDLATWEFSVNPTVAKYNILRGFYYNDVWFYGPQNMNEARLPFASWVAGMNECDLTVFNSLDVEEPQYRCGAEIFVSDQPLDVIDALRRADNSKIAEIGGIFKIRVGAAGSPVLSITDDYVVTTVEQSFESIPSLSSLVNAVQATYPEPLEGWVMKDAPALYDELLEIEDGNRRLEASVPYGMVPYGDQVQRLMLSARNEARKFRKHALVLPPEFFQLEPNDVIEWTSARNSYVDKLFEVVYMDDLANADQAMLLLEVDPEDYTFDPCAYFPRSTTTLSKEDVEAYEIQDWAVAGTTLTGADGRNKAAIALAWNPDVEDLAGIDYQVRLALTDEMVLDSGTTQWASGAILISENILSATTYEVRGRYRPANKFPSEWGDWLSVTTPDARIVEADISNLAIATAALQDTAVTAAKILSGAVTLAKFASGLTPVEVLGALPGSGNWQGRQVHLTTDNKLYRYTGSAWTAAVAAVDVSGQITALQFGAVIGGGNLVVNSSFEVDTNADGVPDGWNEYDSGPTAGTPSIQSTGYHGTKRYRIAWSSTFSSGNKGIYGGFGGVATFKANRTYILSFYARATSGGVGSTPTLQWNTAPSSVTALVTPALTTTDQRYSWKIVWGASVDTEVFITVTGSGQAAGNWELDAVQVEEGDLITAYSPKPDEILANTITVTEIADNAVTTPKLIAGAVVTAKIAAGAITANELGANAVIAGKILAGTIVAGDIASNAITSVKILAGAVIAGKIDTDAVTTGTIAAGAITSDELAANSVVAGKVAADAIGATEIAAGSIVADKLAVNSVTAVKIVAGSIETDKINGLAVTTGKIADNAVTTRGLTAINYVSDDGDIGGWNEIADVGITAIGETIMATVTLIITDSSPDNLGFSGIARFLVDAVQVGGEVSPSNVDDTSISFGITHAPSAGAHTYSVEINRFTGGSPLDDELVTFGGSIFVVEFKK